METPSAYYGGEYFRSELEARWAAFFDAMRLRWRYDRGGFSTSQGRWLVPAFWLPGVGRWVIVRPWPQNRPQVAAPRQESLWVTDGSTGLSSRQASRLIVVYGAPIPPAMASEEFGPDADTVQALTSSVVSYQGVDACCAGHYWTECPKCHRVGIEREGDASRLCGCFPRGAKIVNTASRRLRNAYARAAAAEVQSRPLAQGLLPAEYRRYCMPN